MPANCMNTWGKKMLPDAIRVNSLKCQRSFRYFQKIRWRGIRTEIGKSGSHAHPLKPC